MAAFQHLEAIGADFQAVTKYEPFLSLARRQGPSDEDRYAARLVVFQDLTSEGGYSFDAGGFADTAAKAVQLLEQQVRDSDFYKFHAEGGAR